MFLELQGDSLTVLPDIKQRFSSGCQLVLLTVQAWLHFRVRSIYSVVTLESVRYTRCKSWGNDGTKMFPKRMVPEITQKSSVEVDRILFI